MTALVQRRTGEETAGPFFDERAKAAVKDACDGDALDILARMIADAEHAKAMGYGPPLDDINKVRRMWLDTYARHYGSAA